MVQSPSYDLIFDLGMHHGLDTDFYIRKGFRVVALEANPELCARARWKFADQISSGKLTIVEAALSEHEGGEIAFYINNEKDDWSSLRKDWAEKGGHQSVCVTVPSTTLGQLLQAYGAPHYLKCDIEGADLLFTEQLKAGRYRPNFVSVEAIAAEQLENLRDAGYRRFALINQALNFSATPPEPPLEGRFADVRFNGFMSGLFGKELPPEVWLDYDECLVRYELFQTLKKKDRTLGYGWLDFHASLE